MKKLLLSAILVFSLFNSLQAENAPKISITDIQNKTYQITGTEQGLKIKGLEGKIVFLEFFGHMCPPCLKSIPHLINLQKKHKDKLAIIAIEVQGYNRAQLTHFAKEKGINYITVSQDDSSILVPYIAQRAQWQNSIPFLLILDQKGEVQYAQPGALPEADMENFIQQLISKK
jgi:thiol-disulfide isomerase/thioredoxin